MMVKVDELQNFPRLRCLGSNGYDWIDRDDIYTWFQDPNQRANRTGTLAYGLKATLPDRKLTYKEVGRVSKYIGSAYQMFFVELSYCDDRAGKRREPPSLF
ncbi:uncharacterized protein LOC117316006 isoform X2 [Pecten maximus]|uniref:uncharacterized protein LOC117316006 isoform X2 n=1 Tax=Pecten maximus TaxID=6579 RepID=UPI0014589015|nr:uncharacterized protein LOC117316006 isoform X2 [Pecten maximus]